MPDGTQCYLVEDFGIYSHAEPSNALLLRPVHTYNTVGWSPGRGRGLVNRTTI